MSTPLPNAIPPIRIRGDETEVIGPNMQGDYTRLAVRAGCDVARGGRSRI
jgi:hypothetical protein